MWNLPKVYLEKNVLDAAFERLEFIFDNFDNIYFSVSGGKDSSVMVQLANMVAKKKNKKFLSESSNGKRASYRWVS